VFLFPFFMNVVAVRARLVLGVYLLIDNVLPFLVSTGGGGGVAHGAHIGGFMAGLAGAWLIDRRAVVSQGAGYASDEVLDEAPESTVGGAIGDGDMARAATAYFALSPDQARHALRPEESLALGDWLAAGGHGEAALVVYRRHLRDYPAHATAAAAHLGAGLVQLQQLGQVAPAYQHFLDALDMNPGAETAARARAALSQIAARQKYNIGRPRPRG
jgi:tetratricopeptide (TPR) repeat protein